MTFTYLPQIAHFIQRTHSTFAGFATDMALSILGNMNASMTAFPAICGMTYEAMTDADHSEVNTFITISKLPQGGWQYTESTEAPE